MKARFWIYALLGLAASTPALHADAVTAFRNGVSAFKHERLEEARDAFERALELDTPDDKFDPARAHYNLGNTLYRLQAMEDAEKAFADATRTADISIQADAWFNLGNIFLHRAGALLESGNAAEARTAFQQAQQHFRKSLRLSPSRVDAQRNFELAQRELDRMVMMVRMIRDVVQRAGTAVDEHRYTEAASLLQQNRENFAAAFQLNEELKKQYEQMLQHSGEVAGILAESPTDPRDPLSAPPTGGQTQ